MLKACEWLQVVDNQFLVVPGRSQAEDQRKDAEQIHSPASSTKSCTTSPAGNTIRGGGVTSISWRGRLRINRKTSSICSGIRFLHSWRNREYRPIVVGSALILIRVDLLSTRFGASIGMIRR